MADHRQTTLIAEAGVNHNGDLGLAKELIDAAADAGADFIKFQTFEASDLATKNAPNAAYQVVNTDYQSQIQMLRTLQLSFDDHIKLIDYCSFRKIGFLSSAFDLPSLDFLCGLNLPIFKIPSGEINNLPYLRKLSAFDKPILLSTGMATYGEIEESIACFEADGFIRENITVLHCNSQYPTPFSDVNLRAMKSLGQAFGVKYGYSDHSLGTEVSVAAVALGASVIEKHLTLNRGLKGPDHSASIEPHEFKSLVAQVRNIELALGDGIKRISASESENRSIVRKSLVASTKIRKGEIFSTENITVKRPGTGVSPMEWDVYIGRVSDRDYEPDEFLK